jgi:hypothetical protein
MGLFTPSRRRKPKRFTYEPRFYNPDKEEDLKRRMRVKRRKKRQRSPLSILYLIGLLSFAVFLMYSLGS